MEEQTELIPAEELPDGYTLPEDPKGIYTGERLLQRDPETYRAIVGAMADGMGIRQTARAWKVHNMTVAAIRDREAESIDTVKRISARNLRRFVQVSSERLLEEVDEIPIDKLAIPMGIAAEKAELLEGRPTSIIDHRDSRRIGDVGSIIEAVEVTDERRTDVRRLEGETKGAGLVGGDQPALPGGPAGDA